MPENRGPGADRSIETPESSPVPSALTSAEYERHAFQGEVDVRSRYHLELDPAFPLEVRLYDFPADPRVTLTWHERFEIFCPVSGYGGFRVGSRVEPFEAGDILLVDNLQLHDVETFSGPVRRGVVIVFNDNLVAGPGALPCDIWLLRPFMHRPQDRDLRLAAEDPLARPAWAAVTRLVKSETVDRVDPARTARSKHALLELLLLLEQAWRHQLDEERNYEVRRGHLRRLGPVFELLQLQLDVKPPVGRAARLVGMSSSYFMRFFREATGVPFARYVDHLRLVRAYELLTVTDQPIAEIAAELGFADQAHLSNRIRRRFGASPLVLRRRARAI